MKTKGFLMGQRAQHVAIQLYAGAGECVDKTRVGYVMQSTCGVHALDPESSPRTLLLSTIPVGILPRFLQSTNRDGITIAGPTTKTLR